MTENVTSSVPTSMKLCALYFLNRYMHLYVNASYSNCVFHVFYEKCYMSCEWASAQANTRAHSRCQFSKSSI